MIAVAIFFQSGLLLFHQATTLFDFYPFHNVRQYTPAERLPECFVNGALVALPFLAFPAVFNGWRQPHWPFTRCCPLANTSTDGNPASLALQPAGK